MKYVDPKQDAQERVVLANIYPFIWSESQYDERLARASLMAECLVQCECTIPGSMALEVPEVRKLVLSNLELVKAGTLVLDLRSSVRSYNELAKLKYGKNISEEIRRMADVLDEACPKVLHYDPDQTSDQYKTYMKIFLQKLSDSTDTGHEKKLLAGLIECIEKMNHYLRFADAIELRTNIKKIDDLIEAAGKFFYCVCGGEILHGIVQVPETLWQRVHMRQSVTHINAATVTNATDLSAAHYAVLDQFGVSAEALHRLSARDVLELRVDGATRQALDQLRHVVADVNKEFFDNRHVSRSSLEALSEYQRTIADKVSERAREQAERSGRMEIGELGVDELGPAALDLLGHGIPFFGTARKALLHIGRVLSRKTGEKHLDFTFSPIDTYVTRLSKRIAAQPRQLLRQA
jgi:hypothetical protein